MLFRKNVIGAISEALEGVLVGTSSVLVYGGKQKTGDMPLVEISFIDGRGKIPAVQVASALGIVELSAVEQVHVSAATRETAFIAKASAGKITMVTVSSSGILQVYSNIARSVASKDIAKLSTE